METKRFLYIPAFIIFFLLVICQAEAQKIIINGKEEDRLLTWKDFTGTPDRDSPHDAYTYWFVYYRYTNVRTSGERVTMDFEISVELGNNSWTRKNRQTDRLLLHEQGHFNIARLCGAETEQRMRADTFMVVGYREKIRELFNEILTKYKAMEKQYDQETDHSKDYSQQRKWNAFFEKELVRYKEPVAIKEK